MERDTSNHTLNIMGKDSALRYTPLRFETNGIYQDLIFWFDHQMGTWSVTQKFDLPWYCKPHHMTLKGGILADEMGAGKTVTMIAKCLEENEESYEDYAERHMKNNPLIIPTFATLIVCPQNLLKQWKGEFLKFSNLKLGTELIAIESKLQWNQLTYYQLMHAKVVLVAEAFMDTSNENFYYGDPMLYSDVREQNGLPPKNRQKLSELKLRTAYTTLATLASFSEQQIETFLHQSPVVLHLMFFNRVIYDEMHRFSTKNKKTSFKNVMRHLKAEFYWGLTGTPALQNAKEVSSNLDFLTSMTTSTAMSQDLNNTDDCYRFIHRHIKRFATAEDIRATLPPISEHVTYLDLTLPEQILYQSEEMGFKNKPKRTGAAVDELLVWRRKFLLGCSSHYAMIVGDTAMIKEKATFTEFANQVQKRRLERIKELKASKGKKGELSSTALQKIETLESQHRYYQNASKLLHNVSNPQCNKCHRSLSNDSIHIASTCGHYFCKGCASSFSKAPHSCLVCRFHGHIQVLSRYDAVEDHPSSSSFSGTKMNQILADLKALMQDKEAKNRIILFSEFRGLANLIHQSLLDNGIQSLRIQGMESHRENTKAKWSEESPILILTAEDGAAGLNLPAANHVFLVHPFINKAIEEQAIARAHRPGQQREVKVWRYVTKNTLEEKLWNSRRHNEPVNEIVKEEDDDDEEELSMIIGGRMDEPIMIDDDDEEIQMEEMEEEPYASSIVGIKDSDWPSQQPNISDPQYPTQILQALQALHRIVTCHYDRLENEHYEEGIEDEEEEDNEEQTLKHYEHLKDLRNLNLPYFTPDATLEWIGHLPNQINTQRDMDTICKGAQCIHKSLLEYVETQTGEREDALGIVCGQMDILMNGDVEYFTHELENSIDALKDIFEKQEEEEELDHGDVVRENKKRKLE